MRKKIVAGNWKMNKTLQEGVALATELKDILAAEKPNCEVIIGTPFIHLATLSELLKDSVIAVSAENCANKESGAYTGEVSAAMVKSTGAEYVILGHSERREYYHETPAILKEKVDLALANGLKVIFCIGESLTEREANQQEAVCKAEPARPPQQSRPRKSTPTSASALPTSMALRQPTKPASSMAVPARPAMLPSCSESPTSTEA